MAVTAEDENGMKKRMIVALVVCLFVSLILTSCQQEDSRSIRSAEIGEDGQLIVTYTDGTQSVLGTVKGANGRDGADGKDGTDGKDGADGQNGAVGATGAQGAVGATGATGAVGAPGRGIASVGMTNDGNLKVLYTDSSEETVELLGNLYLFGGMFGKGDATAAWAIYNGGLLVIGGTGATMDYSAGGAPWNAMIPLLTAVYVDYSDGLVLGNNVLYGFDSDRIFGSSVWVDMTVEATLYAEADTNSSELMKLPLGTELINMGTSGTFTKVRYGTTEGYVESRYTVTQNGSVTYRTADCTVTVTNANGAILRTFPDATSGSEQNIVCTVPVGTELHCVGISTNGTWLRIEYQDPNDATAAKKTLYCMEKLVQMPD